MCIVRRNLNYQKLKVYPAISTSREKVHSALEDQKIKTYTGSFIHQKQSKSVLLEIVFRLQTNLPLYEYNNY